MMSNFPKNAGNAQQEALSSGLQVESDGTRPATFKQYLAIARLDHSTKHIFIVPGIVLAYVLRGVGTDNLLLSFILGIATAVCIASANYVINEWFDRHTDKHHPTKSQRSAVEYTMSGTLIAIEWAVLVGMGLTYAALSSDVMLFAAIVFALQGIVYNVPPMRSKDRPYVDVISEAINNPLRLIIGWAIVDPTTLPPGSLILTYWFAGAFLMAAKRLSEYREISASNGIDVLARYRTSFARYTEVSLTASCLAYALFSVSLLSIFLLKYRIEYILVLPLVVTLFTVYFTMSTRPQSVAQKPELLIRDSTLMLICLALVVLFLVTSLVDIPLVRELVEQHYIEIR